MGHITYDGTIVEFDDRTLTHLQVVIMQHFRTGVPLLLSWLDPMRIGDGRSSIWLTPASPIHFKFSGSRSPTIDRAWIEVLMRSAESGAGLVVRDETGKLVHAVDHRPVR